MGTLRKINKGDFDEDGKLDLVTTNPADNTLSVLLGHGDGTFDTTQPLPVGLGPEHVAVADVNGNSKLDLITVNSGSDTVSVLLGHGDGTFDAPTNFPAGNSPTSVEVGDFNGDGKMDLIVTNESVDTVSLLLGHGDGSFDSPISFPVGLRPVSVAVGDLNKDGKLDLVTSNRDLSDRNPVSVLIGHGDGNFTVTHLPSHTEPYALDAFRIVMSDLNGDGNLDMALPQFAFSQVAVYLGHGDGTFDNFKYYPHADGAVFDIAVADMNNDGNLDLVPANLTPMLGNGDGSFTQGSIDRPETESLAFGVVVGDFNGDGKLDMAAVLGESPNVVVLLQE